MSEAGATPCPIVAMGGSAGGLAAFEAFLQALGEQAPAPGIAFIALMHMPAAGKSHLVELLQRHVAMPVIEISDGVVVEPDHLYVLQPGYRVQIGEDRLILGARDESGIPHPIDELFASLGPARGHRAAALVFSGTGDDGSEGLKAMREHGGLVLAQAPESAEYDGMPSSAIRTGCVDAVLEPAEMVPVILDWARRGDAAPIAHEADACKAILATLRANTGLDFRQYKSGTLRRRIDRRIHLNRLADATAYAELVRERPKEREALLDDLLITVTSFFRDGDAWDTLREQAIRPLFDRSRGDASIRAWVAGCASGEEVYSLGILMLEEARKRNLDPETVEIFATDVSEPALQRARHGVYPAAAVTHLPLAWREAYFDSIDDHVRVRPALRERIIFALHNLLADPPFLRLDLVVCRNVQIYLRAEAQQKLTHVFHFALREGGCLFVGNAETVSEEDLFQPVSKAWRIYRRTGSSRYELLDFSVARPMPFFARGLRPATDPPAAAPRQPLTERALVALTERFAPPSVIVDDGLNVLYYHGATDRFLRPQVGEPTHNLLTLAREGLGARIRRLVNEAREKGVAQGARVRLREPDGDVGVGLEVAPFGTDADGSLFRVSFEAETGASTAPSATDEATLAREQELAAEVRFLREENITSVERANRAQEELKSYNEEIISMNEELRATNEELETSKEELQSLNEELKTVNGQLRRKLDELDERTADLDNLLRSSDVATLFLDGDLRIRWFAPRVAHFFNVRESDIGRPIGDLVQRFADSTFAADCQRVLQTLEPKVREVGTDDDRWFVRRIQPYRTADDRIDGVVVTFSDVTDVHRARLFAERIVETIPLPFLVLGTDLRVVSANPAFYATFEVAAEATEGRLVYDLGNGQWNIPELRRLLEVVLPHDEQFAGYEVDHVFETVGRKMMKLSGRQLDHVQLILLAIEDVTAERDLLAQLGARET